MRPVQTRDHLLCRLRKPDQRRLGPAGWPQSRRVSAGAFQAEIIQEEQAADQEGGAGDS